jgi:hypothetical protein
LAPFISYPPNVAFETSDTALNTYAQPGWSFYGDVTTNPQNYDALKNVLDQLGNGQWASPEWLSSASTYNGWVQSLRNSLNYRNNRFINIANWEEIRDTQYILDAIKTVLNETPSCWVSSPAMQSVTVNGNSATLTWQKGTNNNAVYLNISSVGDFNDAGTFNTVDTSNDNVTDVTIWTENNLGIGKYYWELVADGCTNQRKIADGSFVIGSSPPVSKPGDLNGDTKVDINDYNLLMANFGKTGTGIVGDIDGNGKVDIFDYNILVGSFGK